MEQTKKIPTRDQIPAEDKWAIEDLYATDELWEQELATLAEDQAQLASFAGKLAQNGETLFAYLQAMEQVDVKAEKLANYCMRKADEDTRDPVYQAMSGKFMSTVVSLGAATSFDTPEIMAIPDETLDVFYKAYPALERYTGI